MTIPLVTITGSVATPSGGAPTEGAIIVKLSQPGTIAGAAIGGRQIFVLNADGTLPANFALAPNDQITPAGTVWEVTIKISVEGRGYRYPEQLWQVASSPPTIDIDDVVRVDQASGVAYTVRDATTTVKGLVQLTGDLAGTAAAPQVRETHLAAPLPQSQGGLGNATGDASALSITPTGASTTQTGAQTARQAKSVGNREMVVLRKLGPFAIPENPGTEMCDVLIDLAEFGLVHDQYNQVVDLVLTKPGPGGARVMTSRGESNVPGAPAADPPAAGLEGNYVGLMDGGPGYTADGTDPMGGIGVWGVSEYTYGALGPGNRCRVTRLHIKRDAVAYTPEEWAVQGGYQIHVNISGPDNVVDAWRDIPIPATQSEIILNRVIDLNKYGMTSRRGGLRFLLIFKRAGEVIRTYLAGGKEPPWIAHTGEAQYVPPTYPVKWEIRGILDTPGNDYEYESSNGKGEYAFRYGAESSDTANTADGDIFVVSKWGDCNEPIRSKLSLKVWRPADDGATEYVQVRGEAAIAIPAGAKDNCTLDVVMISANALQQALYPFEPDNGGKPDLWVERSRVDALVATAQTSTPYTTATRPAADATWVNKMIPVKDVGAPTELQVCIETATPGEYLWVPFFTYQP